MQDCFTGIYSQRQNTRLDDVRRVVKHDDSAENRFVRVSSSNLEISDESSGARFRH